MAEADRRGEHVDLPHRGAGVVCVGDCNGVFVVMIAVEEVQVPIMDIVGVAVVLDLRVTTLRTVLMRMR